MNLAVQLHNEVLKTLSESSPAKGHDHIHVGEREGDGQ